MPPPPEPSRSGRGGHQPGGPLRAVVGRWARTAATRPWRYAATWAIAIGVANLALRTVLNAQSIWQNAAWAALVALALFAGIGLSTSVLARQRRRLGGRTPPAPQRTSRAGRGPAASHHPVIRVRGVRSSGPRPHRRPGRRWR
jgi:hypothetical protein